jgi:hypothetical protein
VAADLRPFIEDPQSLEAVTSNLSDTLPAQLAELAKHTT